jgi:hypothetical protein
LDLIKIKCFEFHVSILDFETFLNDKKTFLSILFATKPVKDCKQFAKVTKNLSGKVQSSNNRVLR